MTEEGKCSQQSREKVDNGNKSTDDQDVGASQEDLKITRGKKRFTKQIKKENFKGEFKF